MPILVRNGRTGAFRQTLWRTIMDISPASTPLSEPLRTPSSVRGGEQRPPERKADTFAGETWGKKTGVSEQNEEIRKVFGVDKILKKSEYVDLVEESGNKANRSGVIHNLRLATDSGSAPAQGSKLVGNNNILETWKEAPSDKPRRIVLDYSSSPREQQAEKLKPANQVDLNG